MYSLLFSLTESCVVGRQRLVCLHVFVKFTENWGLCNTPWLDLCTVHCRELSLMPATWADIEQLGQCFCDVQIGPFDVQFGPQDCSDWASLVLSHFGYWLFLSFLEDWSGRTPYSHSLLQDHVTSCKLSFCCSTCADAVVWCLQISLAATQPVDSGTATVVLCMYTRTGTNVASLFIFAD